MVLTASTPFYCKIFNKAVFRLTFSFLFVDVCHILETDRSQCLFFLVKMKINLCKVLNWYPMVFIELFVFEHTNVFLVTSSFFVFVCLVPSVIKHWSHVFPSKNQASFFNIGFI